MAGLNDQGLTIKRLPEVNQTFRENAVTLFSSLLESGEILDTSSASALGRLIGVVAPSEVDLWEAIQELYSAFDPNSASGIALDNLVVLSGIVRQGASPTIGLLEFSGDYATTVPSGSSVASTFTANRFNLPSDVTLDETSATSVSLKVFSIDSLSPYTVEITDGVNTLTTTFTSTAAPTELSILTGIESAINTELGSRVTAVMDAVNLVVSISSNDYPQPFTYTISSNVYYSKSSKTGQVVCTENGENKQVINTINTILTPVFGLDSISQKSSAISGRSKETDAQLRLRFNQSKFTRGSSLPESLFSQLVGLVGVQETLIYENTTDSVDAYGIPAHSYMVIVNGGVNQDVAQSIWDNKPTGISPVGNTSIDIIDYTGNTKQIQFQRPTFTPLYVKVDISTFSNFPSDGVSQIKSAIFEYTANISKIAPRVTPPRFFGAANSVIGHEINSLLVGTVEGSEGFDSFSLGFDEIASINISDIEVTIT